MAVDFVMLAPSPVGDFSYADDAQATNRAS
jgi:hypothetical protein